MKYLYIKTDGSVEEVKPFQGWRGKTYKLSLEEMQDYVGGNIELVRLKHSNEMYVNEEGKLNDLPINWTATKIFEESCGFMSDVIVGNVLLKEVRPVSARVFQVA